MASGCNNSRELLGGEGQEDGRVGSGALCSERFTQSLHLPAFWVNTLNGSRGTPQSPQHPPPSPSPPKSRSAANENTAWAASPCGSEEIFVLLTVRSGSGRGLTQNYYFFLQLSSSSPSSSSLRVCHGPHWTTQNPLSL